MRSIKNNYYTAVIVCIFCLIFIFTACSNGSNEDSEPAMFSSFRNVPGVTAEEIRAVEALIDQRVSFVYGTLPSTESFYDVNGEISGFSALFCVWLSELFGIPFEPMIYDWNDLLMGLETGEIDFTGELTASDERRMTYFMTDAIANHSVVYIKTGESPPLALTERIRPLRYGFLSGAVTYNDVYAQIHTPFEAFFVESYDEAYNILRSGEIDAFIDEHTIEMVFENFTDVFVIEDFFPLILTPVSMTTQNPMNEPIITIVQKVLESGGLRYLTELYNLGMYEYTRFKLFSRLTEEERAYIDTRPIVRFVAEHDNYPISFYNVHDSEFQGISFDVLQEIEMLTGIRFELINNQYDDWTVIFSMLENGEAAMVSELIHTPDREGFFLWPETVIVTDNHALLSKMEHPNININEIMFTKVGLVRGYAHTEMFNRWFPDHRYTFMYDNFDQAFEALSRDEVDMVMASRNQLLTQTHYREIPGYKANIVFDFHYESTFGFNRNEYILRSIIDKSLDVLDIRSIVEHWTQRTYDYRRQVAEAQLPWLIGAAVLVLFILFLVFVMLILGAQRKAAREANKLKSDFLARMSHDIRTPLNAVIGLSEIELLNNMNDLSGTGLPDSARDSFTQIHSSGSALLGIINDILDISKIEAGAFELAEAEYETVPFLSDIINTNLLSLKNKPVQFFLDIKGSFPAKLSGDELRVKQILNNILSNAIKYTDKGSIVLEVKSSKIESNSVLITFILKDTGIGIRSEDLGKIFDSYTQLDPKSNRKVEGTWLGLGIANNLAKMMGGSISVQSEYGSGSTFTVQIMQGIPYKGSDFSLFPCIGEQLAGDLRALRYIGGSLEKINLSRMPDKSVLVVDDLRENLIVALGLLKLYGLSIDTALSGQEALEKVKERKHTGQYDLIFMDHMMPGMDGVETVSKIREWERGLGDRGQRSVIPVIAMTANALRGMKEFFLKNDFQDFISKPVSHQALDEVLKKWLSTGENPTAVQGIHAGIAVEIETKRLNKLNHFRAGFENAFEIDSSYYISFSKLIDIFITDSAYVHLSENMRTEAAQLKEAASKEDREKIRAMLPAFYEELKNKLANNQTTETSEQLAALYKEWENND